METPQSQGVNSESLEQAMAYLATICGPVGNRRTVVIRHGVMIWAGPDIDVMQPIFSCTKSFTSTCFGLLWDDGKCGPDTLAASIWPAMKENYPAVTLEHLGTLSSGCNTKMGAILLPGPPLHQPGKAFHYSAQTDLLAYLLTRVAGESLASLFQRRIGDVIGITPQDMKWLDCGVRDGLVLNGGAGKPETSLHMTARNLARFGWLLANGGVWEDKRLLSQRYIDYACVPRSTADLPPYEADGWYTLLPGCYGFNWWVNGVGADGKRMWPHAPASTFAAQGNRNGICLVIPAWNMVIVRLGNDRNINTDLYDGVFERLAPGLIL